MCSMTQFDSFYLIVMIRLQNKLSRIGGVVVSVLASSVVNRGFEPRSVKPKTIKIIFKVIMNLCFLK